MTYNDPKLDSWGPEANIQTISIGAKPKRNTERVRTNLTNGQLWGVDPIPTQATADYEPLWDSGGNAWRPIDDMTSTTAATNGDKLSEWGSEFDNLPQNDFGVDPNLDTSGLQGTSALSSGQGSSPNTTTPSPPTPPSTRPYIWKYQ